MKVLLVPLTDKADDLVKRFGEIWEVVQERTGAPIPYLGYGQWLFVKPYSLTKVTKGTARWVNKFDDDNFIVETTSG